MTNDKNEDPTFGSLVWWWGRRLYAAGIALLRDKPGCRVGICRSFHRPNECGTRSFLGGSGRRAVTRHAWQLHNCLRPRRHSPKKGRFRRQAINLAPPRRGRAYGDGPLSLEDVGLGAPDMNAGLPESMSDGLNWLPPEQGHTWLYQCTDEHSRLKCVPAAESIFGCSLLCLYSVSRCYSAGQGKYFYTQEVRL